MEWSRTITDTLDLWLSWIELSGKSPATRRTYASLTRPLRQLDVPVAGITEQHCADIVLQQLQRNQNSGSITHCALKSFFDWCVSERRIIPSSPMAHVPRPRKHEPPVRPLTPAQLRELMALATDDEERVIVRLLLTGMRAHEITNLAWRDVDLAAGVARLRIAKGRKPRPVYLDRELVALLEHRPRDDARVLPMSTETLRRRLQRIVGRGAFGRVHPHLFRHTWASAFYRKTQDAVTLQSLGGWSNTQSMQRYIKTALQDAAIEKARTVDLTSELLGDNDES